jgi:8-oxo-dGTP diphosphatase
MKERTLCFLTRGNPPQEVLLGFKKIGFGAGKYAGFGGGVEAGETVTMAAIREVAEEASLNVAEHHLQKVAVLNFLFPAKPDWSQLVHVFLAKTWEGEPTESAEMKPVWHPIAGLPFATMWQDASHWLPLILAGKSIKAIFIFAADNETVATATIQDWSSPGLDE